MNLPPDPILRPPRVHKGWYVGCRSAELRVGHTLTRKLHGRPLVLFRGQSGAAGALLDRCPHRNVPLSLGKVVQDTLECGYHGWQFTPEGRCTRIPGLEGEPDRASRCAPSYAVREQQGFVWVWGDPTCAPVGEPFRFPYADRPDYMTVIREIRANGSLHSMAENALDVPHTSFLHGGLFRSDGPRRPIQCQVSRFQDRVECEYIGEARPEGLAGRLLSPGGGEVVHFDRFYLPGIVEVEYRIGDENHIVLSGALTPVDDHDTRMYAVVSLRSRVPGWLLRPIVQPLALYIFRQDAVVLAAQTENLHAFGRAETVSTEIDLLGPHILKLLLRASQGDVGDPGRAPMEKQVTLYV